jgi:hypothetical protein
MERAGGSIRFLFRLSVIRRDTPRRCFDVRRGQHLATTGTVGLGGPDRSAKYQLSIGHALRGPTAVGQAHGGARYKSWRSTSLASAGGHVSGRRKLRRRRAKANSAASTPASRWTIRR